MILSVAILLTGFLVCPVAAETAAVPPQALAQPPYVVPPYVSAGGTAQVAGEVLPRPTVTGLNPGLVTLNFAENGEDIYALPADGLFSRTYEAISYWVTFIVNGITNGLTPPSPETFAKSMNTTNPNDFWRLVGDAGYSLKEISTDVGVIPDVGFRFKYVRELSEGDVNWLERRLTHHGQAFRDPLSLFQRTVIYTLLSINASDVYYVDELRVKLLPLPKVQFSVMPWDSGLSEEHYTLLRAIQGKKQAKRKLADEDDHY
ncbi:MAG: hypothetical protein WCK65_08650 [Rhodospirillaceae bacterium]